MRAMANSNQPVRIEWRAPVSDAELVDLTQSHGGEAEAGWWDRVRTHSLGWVTARTAAAELVGFVNVAWDGGAHAFLIDTKTRPTHQRQGLGVAVVNRAIAEAQAAGCEWLFVDSNRRWRRSTSKRAGSAALQPDWSTFPAGPPFRRDLRPVPLIAPSAT